MVDLSTAKTTFQDLLSKLDNNAQDTFFEWLNDEYKVEFANRSLRKLRKLDKIANYLRKKFPFGSNFSSNEKIRSEVSGINATSNLDKTIEIDGFLYDDDGVDDLVEEGLIKRYYCKDCDSTNIGLYDFITHSVSREILQEIFTYYLDANLLKGGKKVICDIGSRLGAFLFGCYLLGPDDCEIIGIELNKDLCDIQTEVINKFKFQDRIRVINDDVRNCSQIVSTSDVIFLHNVFEFFASDEAQIEIWKFLRENIKESCILLTIPSVKDMTKSLLEESFVDDWLVQLNSSDDQNKIYLYEVS